MSETLLSRLRSFSFYRIVRDPTRYKSCMLFVSKDLEKRFAVSRKMLFNGNIVGTMTITIGGSNVSATINDKIGEAHIDVGGNFFSFSFFLRPFQGDFRGNRAENKRTFSRYMAQELKYLLMQ